MVETTTGQDVPAVRVEVEPDGGMARLLLLRIGVQVPALWGRDMAVDRVQVRDMQNLMQVVAAVQVAQVLMGSLHQPSPAMVALV